MMKSSLTLLFTVRRRTKVNHTASTKEYSVVFATAGKPPSVSSMHFYSERDLESYLRYLGVEERRRNVLLRNLWSDIPVSTTLREQLFQEMPVKAGLQDWMDAKLIYLEWTWGKDGIWLCLAIFRTEKPS